MCPSSVWEKQTWPCTWGRWEGDAGQIPGWFPEFGPSQALWAGGPTLSPLSGWGAVVGSTAQVKMLGMKIRAISSPSCRLSQAVNSGCCERRVMTRHHLKHCYLCSAPYSSSSLQTSLEEKARVQPGSCCCGARTAACRTGSGHPFPGRCSLPRAQGCESSLSSALGWSPWSPSPAEQCAGLPLPLWWCFVLCNIR